jgi:predicted ribosome quality control (RQC) complex YloA/Tae2 family protein
MLYIYRVKNYILITEENPNNVHGELINKLWCKNAYSLEDICVCIKIELKNYIEYASCLISNLEYKMFSKFLSEFFKTHSFKTKLIILNNEDNHTIEKIENAIEKHAASYLEFKYLLALFKK